MYHGKEICQGCNRPGSEMPRRNKSELCESCKALLEIGKARQFEDTLEYVEIFQHFHALSSLSFADDRLNISCHKLLSALSNGSAKAWGIEREGLKGTTGNNGRWYIIPKSSFEPLKELFSLFNEEANTIKEERKNLPKLASIEVQKEKDRIYNEGVAKGRDLIFQLNSGEITMDQFESKHTYRK